MRRPYLARVETERLSLLSQMRTLRRQTARFICLLNQNLSFVTSSECLLTTLHSSLTLHAEVEAHLERLKASTRGSSSASRSTTTSASRRTGRSKTREYYGDQSD